MTDINDDDIVDDELTEDEDESDDIIRAKWTIDGAATLAEAADRLEVFAAALRRFHDEGFLLRASIDDDYGFVYHPDGKRMYETADQ